MRRTWLRHYLDRQRVHRTGYARTARFLGQNREGRGGVIIQLGNREAVAARGTRARTGQVRSTAASGGRFRPRADTRAGVRPRRRLARSGQMRSDADQRPATIFQARATSMGVGPCGLIRGARGGESAFSVGEERAVKGAQRSLGRSPAVGAVRARRRPRADQAIQRHGEGRVPGASRSPPRAVPG